MSDSYLGHYPSMNPVVGSIITACGWVLSISNISSVHIPPIFIEVVQVGSGCTAIIVGTITLISMVRKWINKLRKPVE